MNDQDYILFDAYLSNTLSIEECTAFEMRLKTETELNEAFTLYKEINGMLEQHIGGAEEKQDFEENLSAVSDAYFSDQAKVSRAPYWKFAIAASIALLFGLFMFNNFSSATYGNFADHDTISLTLRGEDNDLIKQAETSFNNGDYKRANEVFTKILETDDANIEIQFYRAITNIELNNYAEAEEMLERISKGQSVFKNQAAWYMALSKLKQKRTEECVEILRTIPEDAEVYKRAQKLLKKLQ